VTCCQVTTNNRYWFSVSRRRAGEGERKSVRLTVVDLKKRSRVSSNGRGEREKQKSEKKETGSGAKNEKGARKSINCDRKSC
jgi:hypothetical protein